MTPSPDIRVRRVYDQPEAADGARVLVDRIWPRGLRKDAVRLDDWAKDVAPSSELRTWYGHDPAKLGEFRQRYLGELGGAGQRAALGRLRALAFFFSSRRRHTRWNCDWSSDVCSSDLQLLQVPARHQPDGERPAADPVGPPALHGLQGRAVVHRYVCGRDGRE